MDAAAIGVRMHSGWGTLVVVAGDPPAIEVQHRQRIVIIDSEAPGAKQPYHFAAEMPLADAQEHLNRCAAASADLAFAGIRSIVEAAGGRNHRIVGAAVLLASGRALPALPEILRAHPLIHTAEGEFFRRAVWKACERLQLVVVGIPERTLDEHADVAFGNLAPQLQRNIASLRNSLGAPWTEDHKHAALAASIVLKTYKAQSAAKR